MRVLICDDHVVFADSVAHLLTSRGMDVVAVTYDPSDAVRQLAKTQVDVCILDFAFGSLSVVRHLPALQAAAPTAKMMILAGALDVAGIAACQAAGVHGFAEKRQSANEIIAIIEHVAAGRPVTPSNIGAASARSHNTPSTEMTRRLAMLLTPRERQVLSALVNGQDTVGLAKSLGITRATARSHVQSMISKLNVHSRLEAATTAVRNGLLDPETGKWLV